MKSPLFFPLKLGDHFGELGRGQSNVSPLELHNVKVVVVVVFHYNALSDTTFPADHSA